MTETLVCDIETNGLHDSVTKIHCICMKHKGSSQVDVYFDGLEGQLRDGTIDDAVERLSKAGLVIGHNWIDYDVRVIKKFYPEFPIKISKIRDTLLRSYLFNPSREKHVDCPASKTTVDGRKTIGIHGLENWGYIVGRGKVEHEDWTTLTPEMVHRCVEDVHITDLVDDYLDHEAGNWDWSQAETIEKWFRYILSEQESYGVMVDQEQINWCIEQLTAEVEKIDEEVLPQIPLIVNGTEKPTSGLKKDGTPTAYSLKYIGHSDIVGDYCKVSFDQINLQSDKQIKEYLLSQGWQPIEWNYKKDGKKILKDDNGEPIKTSPKITEESLDSVNGETGKLIAKRITVQHRLSQITGWLDNTRNDGRLGAGGNSVGTNTGRVTHRCVVNVPKAEDSVFYGKEMRSIFTVPEGYKMVGADLSALENRIAAHYCVPMTAQALTRRGWKTYYELRDDDILLTYNPKTKVKEWQPMLSKHKFIDAETYEHRIGRKNIRSTANHRWFVDYRNADKKQFIECVRTTEQLNSNTRIITNAEMNENISKGVDDFILEKFDYNWVERVIDMTNSQRSQFLQGFCLADGMLRKSTAKNKPRWVWSQNEGDIAEAAIIASYLVSDKSLHIARRGYKSGDHIVCTIGNSNRAGMYTKEKKLFGKEDVWCPCTENGSWVMRQGDVITITGNTYKSDGGEFAHRVLKEDPHQYIANQLGIDRNKAKGINYGIMYGAGVVKVQEMLGCSFQEAKIQYNRWWDANPALKDLRARIKKALQKHPGWIKGIDGRKIFIRSEHSAMNALFQNAGSMVNKLSTIMIYKEMKRQGIQGHFVLNMHDEVQAEILEKDVDRYCSIVLGCYRKAGEYFNLNVPIEGEAKIGDNWKETH